MVISVFHALVKHFSLTHSDHYPLILNTDPENHSNPKPFRLESMWVKHSSFDNLVYNHQPSNSPNYLASLKNLTNAIIIWNKRIFDNFLIRKNKSQQDWKVSKLSSKVNTILTSHLLKKILQNDLNGLLLKEKQYWAMKSCISWINFGDANTSVFHYSTLKRRCANKIFTLRNGAEI